MQKNYTSSREVLVKYDYIAKTLLLDAEDKEINLRLLNDAFQDVKAYLELPIDEMYNSENVPPEIKEACISLFAMKHSMYKDAADWAKGDEIEDIIEEKFESGKLDFDDFFLRFSDIPYDIALLLDNFKANLRIDENEMTA